MCKAIGLGLVLVGICGCSSMTATKQPDVTGEWVGRFQVVKNPAGGENADTKATKALAQQVDFSLKLNPDGQFSMVFFIVPLKGTWKQNGSTITLQPTEAMGEAVKSGSQTDPNEWGDPMTMTVAEDGKTMTLAAKGSYGEGITTFSRKGTK